MVFRTPGWGRTECPILGKLANLVDSGGQATECVQAGDGAVNGEVCLMRGKKIRPGDDVCFQGKHYTVSYAD